MRLSPEGLEVRPVTPDQYRQIWDADFDAFRESWGFAEPSPGDYEQWLEDPVIMMPELWQIAWNGDQVAGQVRSFINHQENAEQGRLRGYTEFISVRKPWRRARPGLRADYAQPARPQGTGYDRSGAERGHRERLRGAAPLRALRLSPGAERLDLPQAVQRMSDGSGLPP